MREFLFCFHDIGIHNYKELQPLISDLKDLIGASYSLLIIPSVKNATEEEIECFKKTLKSWEDEGFELVLHGAEHKANLNQKRNLKGKIALKLTRNEAEFAGLNEGNSLSLLQKALSYWSKLELETPVAFVAPTWYGNSFLLHQVHALKILHEARFTLVTARGKRLRSPAISFAGLPNVIKKISFKFGNFFLKFPLSKRFYIPRIAVHPEDFKDLKEPICDTIRVAISKRKLVQYKDL